MEMTLCKDSKMMNICEFINCLLICFISFLIVPKLLITNHKAIFKNTNIYKIITIKSWFFYNVSVFLLIKTILGQKDFP